MYLKMARRVLFETDKRLLWKLAYNFGFKGALSVQRFKRRMKKGEYFPPFLYVSVINSCNLRCQGCWVDVSAKQQTIDLKAMNRLITDAYRAGNSFFGIVGGEPFMHPQLLDIFRAHPNCYFQVFTNGHFITDEVARELRKIGNVTPLISVEGTELISDERRGRADVLSKTMAGLNNCLKHKLLTGVCTSVCQTNFNDFIDEKWIDTLIKKGVLYTWFHVYRPMGPKPEPGLSLTREQQTAIRKFVVEMRVKKPIGIIDAYYDGEGQALCPAAAGLTHHINPWGGIEPCPIVQFAKESIHDERPIDQVISQSKFLAEFRRLAATTTRGCIVLERPDLLHDLVVLHDAGDQTARKSAHAELQAMTPRPSQGTATEEIPERSWAYRIAKRLFFNDFGAYANLPANRS
ncbi:radical SAM/SPASM domain-containing protein [Planctomicrobium sp. SH668]|uniref:radical SAM/SPASM domain-containing protein n=1 Tax=Planctomicrobium sp. SH668 TaxID=3448126 RepID=UPI003F5B46CA